MKKLILIILISITFLSQGVPFSFGLEQPTHEVINKFIADNIMNGFSFDSYLKEKLGFVDGINAILNANEKSSTVSDRIKAGGNDEDDPMKRSLNHFHDPLKTNLSDAGFSGIWNRWPKGESTILWSQKDKGMQDSSGANYSWYDTRDYFHKALTAETKNDREKYFAMTFEGIGHLMHLITDMSVPEHTRDDGHYLGWLIGYTHYEKYVKKYFIPTIPRLQNIINNFSPVFMGPDVLYLQSPFQEATVPIANLFDRNGYDGDPTYTRGAFTNLVGLSEFTNANFLSPDTMFTSEYPCPNVDTGTFWKDNNRRYISSGFIKHLAVEGRFFSLRRRYFPNENQKLPVGLDNECYKEYAQNLIPRAVGYSANLMQYFFRGTIEITDPVIGFSGATEGFDSVTLFAGNTSQEQEAMSDGTVSLVVKYKYDENDQFLSVPGGPRDEVDEFYYIVKELDDTYAIPITTEQTPDSVELQFDLSETPIPLNAKEIYVYVVYRGQLGNEADGIGVGYKEVALRSIEVKVSNKGVYALSDLDIDTIDPTHEGFDHITVFAKNISTDGVQMNNGAVSLVVKYMVAQQNQFENLPPAPDYAFEYTVKTLFGGRAIPRDDFIMFDFDLTDKQIPLYATDVYLYLLFNETNGSGAQSAFVGFKDICEPTPLIYYNSKDKICLDSQAYDAGSDAAIALVDANHGEKGDRRIIVDLACPTLLCC